MNDEQLKATLKEMNDTAEKILDAVSIVGHLSKSMRDGESLVGWVKRMIAERDAALSFVPPQVDKPVVPGWYWFKNDNGGHYVVEVWLDRRRGLFAAMTLLADMPPGSWRGPLVDPWAGEVVT